MDSIWHLPLCLWHNFHLIKLCSTYVCIFVFLSYACFGRSVSSEVIISIHLTVKQARNHFWTCHQFLKVQYDERCISFQLLQIEFDCRSDKLGYFNKNIFSYAFLNNLACSTQLCLILPKLCAHYLTLFYQWWMLYPPTCQTLANESPVILVSRPSLTSYYYFTVPRFCQYSTTTKALIISDNWLTHFIEI